MENSVPGLVLRIPKSSSNPNTIIFPTLLVELTSKPKETRLGPQITQAVKGKLSLRTKFLQTGGVSKVFEQSFNVQEREKLLKVFQCYLSTTAGPIFFLNTFSKRAMYKGN